MSQTMTKLTGSAKTAATVAKRKARLEATGARVKARHEKAHAKVVALEEELKRVKAKISEAKKKERSVEEYAVALVAKQTAELKAAEEFHAVTLKREQEKGRVKAKQAKETTPPPAGTVENEDGQTFDLSADAVAVIKEVLGRRKKGVLSPLEGEEAQKVLDVVGKNAGDIFTVRLTGRTTTTIFSVEEDGLAFETTK